MGVYIKGMEMPDKCCECKIRYEMFCPLLHRFIADEGRRHNCPLGEVPTPHGRLIDADDFLKNLVVKIGMAKALIDDEFCRKIAEGLIESVIKDVGNQPTIVEAEGET